MIAHIATAAVTFIAISVILTVLLASLAIVAGTVAGIAGSGYAEKGGEMTLQDLIVKGLTRHVAEKLGGELFMLPVDHMSKEALVLLIEGLLRDIFAAVK